MGLTPTIQRNGNDSYVTPATPSLNYSGSTTILTKSAGAGSESRGLIYFARSFPLGVTIQSATLRLYQTSTESVAHTIELHRITQGWSLSTVNWNNTPDHTATGKIVKTQAAGVAGAEWAFDVTTMMQTVADGGLWGGFKIISTTDDYLAFWSTQATLKPQLEVTWLDNPDAPTTLSPAGNRAVSIAKPILRFDFTDVAGNTSLQAVQVQINASNTWTAPTFDSGTYTTTVPQLDLTGTFPRTATVTTTNLSATVTAASGTFAQADVGATITGTGIPAGATITAFSSSTSVTISAAATASGSPTATITRSYAGLANGSSVWWRARTQDGAGLWSAWSAGQQFSRVNKGTLAMSNPPVGGAITDSTPPVNWSLTGATQSAWQVFLVPAVYQDERYNSGKVAGTATSHTLPPGSILDDSSYTLYLRVWDTVNRETTPGDPAYAEIVRAISYTYSGTVTPATGAGSTDLAPVPGATITWSRATAPDSFTIRRNGVIIASGLTPASLSTGGTSYAYTDYTADPRVANTWRVDSVVNAVTSASNPTTTRTLAPRGIWLRDPSRNLAVQLFGRDPGTWEMGEEAATHAPIGGDRSIRITQALRGFEGTITGVLMASDAGSVASQLSALWEMKRTPGRYYILTLSDMTLEVVIGNVVPAPVPLPEYQKAVSFDFWARKPPFTPAL